jgi:electron transfer flavoprotein alpha subunit
MRKLFVLAELAGGSIDDGTWELAAAARSLGGSDAEGCRVAAVLLGKDVGEHAGRLAGVFDDVYVFDDPLFEQRDGEAEAAVLVPLIEREKPFVTLIAHTNTGMDLAPALSVKVGMPLIADCISLELKEERLSAVRTVYGGKVHARITAVASPNGYMATVRPGVHAAAEPAGGNGEIHKETLPKSFAAPRRFVKTVEPEPGEVDITQAEKLVGIGRGIEEEENIEIIESLAEALGAEVACSRPVVDKKWLAKSRQVGTSGVMVKPKVYIAVGISGSFQHIGGVKGGPFLVAINKDPRAPIFGVADVGIVGDLFEVVPLLEEKIREAKG